MTNWNQLKNKLLQYCCPPGSGVYTVHTGQDKKANLETRLYGVDGEKAKQQWINSLDQLADTNQPIVLGICSDSGGGILRGANWGPLYIREALYSDQKNLNVFELGDVRVIPQLLLDDLLNEEAIKKCRHALYANEDSALAVSPLSMTEDVVTSINHLYKDKVFLSLGGDHSISYPLLKAYLKHKAQQQKKVAVIHFDAHTDIMPQRLGIDICFGSWVYHILKNFHDPSCWIQLGIRSTGHSKKYWESKYGIQQYWADEVNQDGAQKIAEKIIAHLKSKNIDELYITFDIDSLDVQYAAATGTPENKGLTLDNSIKLILLLQHAFPVTGADITEVAPFINAKYSHSNRPEPETTLASACAIVKAYTSSTDLSDI